MEKVTITLDEKVAAGARQHAARRNISLSQLVSELIKKTMVESPEYESAMRRYLSRKPSRLKRSSACYPSRDKLHDRGRVR